MLTARLEALADDLTGLTLEAAYVLEEHTPESLKDMTKLEELPEILDRAADIVEGARRVADLGEGLQEGDGKTA